MSFSQDTKNYLCGIVPKNKCCRISMLYGLLLFGNTFNADRIRVLTENERTSEQILRLLRECFGIKGNLYLSEKKAEGQKYSSYKVTISAAADHKTIFKAFGYGPDTPLDSINRNMFVCPECIRSFFRGAFLSAGTISDPESASGYRLDITDESESLINDFSELCGENGLSAKTAARKTSFVAYFKESEAIEDFLTFIGAGQAALSIMNVKIFREIRNNENRKSNCDVANISKSTAAARIQIKSINNLIEKNIFDLLPDDLKTTAELRLGHPEASLEELASLHTPPISKSGVNHRIKKITEYFNK